MSQSSNNLSTRPLVWATCILSTVAASLMLGMTHTAVEIGPMLALVGLVIVMPTLHLIYTFLRPEPRIGAMMGGLAAVTWAGIAAGVTALAALRTNAPLIDTSLAHADALVGLDTVAFVEWVAQNTLVGWILDVAYLSTVPLLLAVILLQAWLNREDWMWHTCFLFAAGGTLCAVASAFLPAIAAFTYYGVPSYIIATLPNGAGRFFLATFEGYRSGTLNTINVFQLEGVVTFPSFHAVMALMIGSGVRGRVWLSGLAWAWSGLILIATIPIGGHYVVDLVAGAAVWGTLTILSPIHFSAIWLRWTNLQPKHAASAPLGASGLSSCPNALRSD
jgi:hypothetical protein